MFWLKRSCGFVHFLLHRRSKDKQQTLLVSRWHSPSNVVLRGPEGDTYLRIPASFPQQSCILKLCHFNPRTPVFLPQHRIPCQDFSETRLPSNDQIRSRYFAFSRIPHCISVNSRLIQRISFLTLVLVGSLSNYDDGHNDDFTKTIGLMIKTSAPHVHHAFSGSTFLWRPLHDYDLKPPWRFMEDLDKRRRIFLPLF